MNDMKAFYEAGVIYDNSLTMQQNMQKVDDILRIAANTPGVTNKMALAVDQASMMRTKNGGYPKHMYHPVLDMRVVKSDKEEIALIPLGYSPNYIRRDYPKVLYRRNMSEKFEFAEHGEYIESRLARSAQHEAELRKEPIRKSQGQWVEKLADMDPLPDAPEEDPALVIERLRGQLQGMQQNLDVKERQLAAVQQGAAPGNRKKGAEQSELVNA